MNLNSALRVIREDMPPELQEASVRLTEYVYRNYQDIKHLTYSRIAQVIGTYDTTIVLAVVQYCTGVRINLLDMKFELILGSDIFELDNVAIYNAQESGILIHPETGYAVEDYESHVYPFFVPSKAVGNDECA